MDRQLWNAIGFRVNSECGLDDIILTDEFLLNWMISAFVDTQAIPRPRIETC